MNLGECYNEDCFEQKADYRCNTCLTPKTKLCDGCYKNMRSSEYVFIQTCPACGNLTCLDCFSAEMDGVRGKASTAIKFCRNCRVKLLKARRG